MTHQGSGQGARGPPISQVPTQMKYTDEGLGLGARGPPISQVPTQMKYTKVVQMRAGWVYKHRSASPLGRGCQIQVTRRARRS